MMPETPCPPEFITLAEKLAEAAREVTLGYFRTPVSVEDKDDASPVTVADREAEAAIRSLITAAYPEHGIVGEEHGSERADAEFVWVLDPIDGTRSFIIGDPEYGTLISLVRKGRPVLGLIDMPALDERWLGVAGRPTVFSDRHRGARAVRCRPCPGLSAAVLRVTDPANYEGSDRDVFERLLSAVRTRRYSGDCYNYGQVASGFVDIVAESGLGTYDYCALAPVVEGSGGIITDWSGRPLGLDSDGRVLACGDPACHAEALAILGAG